MGVEPDINHTAYKHLIRRKYWIRHFTVGKTQCVQLVGFVFTSELTELLTIRETWAWLFVATYKFQIMGDWLLQSRNGPNQQFVVSLI